MKKKHMHNGFLAPRAYLCSTSFKDKIIKVVGHNKGLTI